MQLKMHQLFYASSISKSATYKCKYDIDNILAISPPENTTLKSQV